MLPSRNKIPQSAIGIDNNEQSDYLTCIQRTDALDLRGQNSCSIFETQLNTVTWNACTISRILQAKMVLKCIRIASTDMLNSKHSLGEIPRTPLTRGGYDPLEPSALEERQWCSIAVPLFKKRRRPCEVGPVKLV